MTTNELISKFDKFLSDNNGKYIERVDSNALNQCFDLAIYWCENLGYPKSIYSGLLSADVRALSKKNGSAIYPLKNA